MGVGFFYLGAGWPQWKPLDTPGIFKQNNVDSFIGFCRPLSSYGC